MDTYTKLDRAGPVSPLSGGVWKIRKKQKADDRKRRDEKKKRTDKGEKEIQDKLTIGEQKIENPSNDLDTEEEYINYGSPQKKGRIKGKIDLKI